MNYWSKLRNKNTREAMAKKDKGSQEGIRHLLRDRAKFIRSHKTSESSNIKSHFSSTIFGIEWALSELGIDIKRYGL